jgi:thiosulfate/3-mercaptopyruvate sulfurtransferase
MAAALGAENGLRRMTRPDNPKGYENPHLLITSADLAASIGTSGSPVVLDLRPAEQFATGHIPGAVHLDLFGLSVIDTSPAPLAAFSWMIGHLLASRGVEPTRPVVVYDEQSGIRSARAFWFLEYFGHPQARVLDGGFDFWERDGHTPSLDFAKPHASRWTVGAAPERLATWSDLRDRLRTPDVAILDTRTDGEYLGATVRAKRGGAVPGAVHIEWTRNLDDNGAFKSADQLNEMYREAGITRDKEVVTYCQGGYRAAHSYLALRLIGYPRVRNYIGSWKEWGDRDDLPIEVPQTGD